MTATSCPLADRHAVVTGGGRGIGAAVAHRLASQGAHLTLLGRDLDMLKTTGTELPESARAHLVICDVADPAAVDAAFEDARQQHGRIDLLVNNAGQAASAPFLRTDDVLWQTMIGVNLTGTFLCTRAALPDMLAAGMGRIVNIASTAGLRGYRYVAAYSAAKHGVIGLTRSLALEVATKGITVNAVCPGFTDTDLLHESIAEVVTKTGRDPQSALAEFIGHNPQGRLIEPVEIADTVAWLCSDLAASVTGQAISVSGGEVT